MTRDEEERQQDTCDRADDLDDFDLWGPSPDDLEPMPRIWTRWGRPGQ